MMRLRLALGVVVVAYMAAPPLLAYVVFGVDDAFGCNSCLHPNCSFPDVPWYVALPALLMIGAVIALFAYLASLEEIKRQAGAAKESEEKEKKLAEDKKKWPWLVEKKVSFILAESKRVIHGVVVHQDEDNVFINWLNDKGELIQSKRTVEEVTVETTDNETTP